jgi:hypothetical protein
MLAAVAGLEEMMLARAKSWDPPVELLAEPVQAVVAVVANMELLI